MSPRQTIIDTLKDNGIKVKTKKEQTHQGMGQYVRGGRDVNKFRIRLFVSDVKKAKELITPEMIKEYEQYCLIRYGITTLEFREIEKYDLAKYLENKQQNMQ